jgi:SAM-dependent methyltransferase
MAIEAITSQAPDAFSLLALAADPGARTLAIRSADAAEVDARLSARGCINSHAVTVAAALDAFGQADPFDLVCIADGFEQLADPVATLKDAASLLAPAGRVVVVAQNATSLGARVRAFLGEASADPAALPPRQYDLAALERVIAAAGLVVHERLRVFDDEELTVPAELAALADGPDAYTQAFVLVLAAASSTRSPGGESLAEVLQQQVDSASRRIARAAADHAALEAARAELLDELRAVEAKLADATRQMDDQTVELAARADALVERVELVERLHTERRHLELDLAVKDDYIADLRTEFTDLLNLFNALLYKYEVLQRSRPVKMAKLLRRMMHPFRDESEDSGD